MSLRLTPNFTLEEFTRSDAAARHNIKNTPSLRVRARLLNTAQQMELVRAGPLNGHAVNISSGYRNDAVNHLVGGAPTSDHKKGDALDFRANSFGTPLQVAHAIAQSAIKFDQLIYEFGWVHLSFGPRMRGQIMTIKPREFRRPGLPPLPKK